MRCAIFIDFEPALPAAAARRRITSHPRQNLSILLQSFNNCQMELIPAALRGNYNAMLTFIVAFASFMAQVRANQEYDALGD